MRLMLYDVIYAYIRISQFIKQAITMFIWLAIIDWDLSCFMYGNEVVQRIFYESYIQVGVVTYLSITFNI